MKPTVYVETTIPSYLTAWPSRDLVRSAHQRLTKLWWRTRRRHFRLVVSQFVLDEAAGGDAIAAAARLKVLAGLPRLLITEEVAELAATVMLQGEFPPKAAQDAAHIAVAAVHGVDFLLTWNCTHINNAQLLPGIQQACRQAGFHCPVICTPEELMTP